MHNFSIFFFEKYFYYISLFASSLRLLLSQYNVSKVICNLRDSSCFVSIICRLIIEKVCSAPFIILQSSLDFINFKIFFVIFLRMVSRTQKGIFLDIAKVFSFLDLKKIKHNIMEITCVKISNIFHETMFRMEVVILPKNFIIDCFIVSCNWTRVYFYGSFRHIYHYSQRNLSGISSS